MTTSPTQDSDREAAAGTTPASRDHQPIGIVIALITAFLTLLGVFYHNNNAVTKRIDGVSEDLSNLRQEVGILIGQINAPRQLRDPADERTQKGEVDSAQSEVAISGRTPVEISTAQAQASSLAEEGTIDEAIAAWHQVLAMDEDGAYAFDAYLEIAILESERGRLYDSIEMYSRAIELRPDMAGVYFNRGTVKNDLGSLRPQSRTSLKPYASRRSSPLRTLIVASRRHHSPNSRMRSATMTELSS